MEYNLLGDQYQKNTNIEIRKSIGQYYTPDFIIKYILHKTIGMANVVDKPFIKVIDISCGAGYFLSFAYDMLKDMFLQNIDSLRKIYKEEIYTLEVNESLHKVKGDEYWREENLHYHILKYCIYGADKDSTAVKLTKLVLLEKEKNSYVKELNIVECDSLYKWEKHCGEENNSKEINRLAEFWSRKFDYVIGNPPYIGHKQLDMEYKKWLLTEYNTVFKNKSDISFCFLKRIADILSPNGVSGIITSRYFMESPTGKQLREYILDNIDILEIVDFYGAEIFKGIGVATAIYFFQNKRTEDNKITIYKLINDKYKFKDLLDLQKVMDTEGFNRFTIEQKSLGLDRWILIPKDSYTIYKKIHNKLELRLGDIVTSFQGIITGCDKAFVLSMDEVKENNIEKDLLKKWIKNKNIERYKILEPDLFLIYADLIKDEGDYPKSIEFIKKYREKLENRRECRLGTRSWYQLQWGRDMTLFQQPKIVFPYKSNANRFALDYDNTYCSADVYSMVIKEEYRDRISLEYLVGLLNSSIYEFYFKLFAKKISKGMYDYYPNSVLDMKIITEKILDDIIIRSKEIMKLVLELENNNGDINIANKITRLELEIDEIVGDYLGLDKREQEYIKYN